MPRNKESKGRLKRVAVRVERRAEPDWDRFAYALLQHVKVQSAAAKQPRHGRET